MVLFYAALGGLLVEGCPFTYFGCPALFMYLEKACEGAARPELASSRPRRCSTLTQKAGR